MIKRIHASELDAGEVNETLTLVLKCMRQEIRRAGRVLQPIDVWVHGKKYRIKNGHLRVLAVQQLLGFKNLRRDLRESIQMLDCCVCGAYVCSI